MYSSQVRETIRRPYDLEERLIRFAASVSGLAEDLPSTRLGNHVARQLIRCATSTAANYGEAQSGESRRDFIHKLKLCLKELRETIVWLKFVRHLGMNDEATIDAWIGESDELAAILYRSIETAISQR